MKSTTDPGKVVVLYNESDELIKGEARDLLAERGVIACAKAVSNALADRGYQIASVPFQSDVELALRPYPAGEWNVFNLGEGLSGRLFEEARIAWALEAMGYCFTGANGDAIARSLNKMRAKQLLIAAGVKTPPGWLLRHPDEVDTLSEQFPYPLIVKPCAEGGSIGLDEAAVVHTERMLRDRVAYITECYRQAALVETFIDGREFNIALWDEEPVVLPLAEIDFSAFSNPYERIVSFSAKWEEDSFQYNHTPAVCPADVDPRLSERITRAAKKAWKAIGCRGYARVDLRVSKDQIPYVMEVNCNPDISPDAGFYRAANTAGFNYTQMVVRITEIARRAFYAENRYGLGERRAIDIGHHVRIGRFQFDGSKLRRRALERV